MFSRLFRLIDPSAFSVCLQRFAQELATAAKEAGIVANDGKGLRTALARARGSTFNAFSSASGLALGQAGVSAGTSEIATLQELLALLDLKGQTVAADAIHCQRGDRANHSR
jgi:hypothetical protein